MRYEVKIGILALVAIALAFWGYKYIKGSNVLSNSNNYHVFYNDVAGLTPGTPVTISGVTVGAVADIQLDQASNIVKVTLDVDDDINVPMETVASITTVSIMGEKAVVLSYTKPCFDGNCAPEGSELEGKIMSLLSSFTGGSSGESPLDGMKESMNGVLDSLKYLMLSPESDSPIARSTNDLAVTMNNLKYSTARLQGILDANAGEISTTMDNLASLTSTLATKQESIAEIIDNAREFSGGLNELKIEQTMQEVNQTIAKLKGTLNSADKAVAGVSGIMNKVNSGEGTLGKLLNDDKIYQRLNSATIAADTLLSDFQERPYRYIPFKSRKRVLRHDRKDEALQEEPQNR